MNKILTEPEILTRLDLENGPWDVQQGPMKRGAIYTDLGNRKMVVPYEDDPGARVMRAHEMMHGKVSPKPTDWVQWVERGVASEEALTACEEARVNLLCARAGFNVKEHLTDNCEDADGERMVAVREWRGAVYFAVATAGTASAKKFLNGVRRHDRQWGSLLLDVQKKTIRHFKAASSRQLTDTGRTPAGLAPYGFQYTELLAEWVDRVAGKPPVPEGEESEPTDDAGMPEPDVEETVKGGPPKATDGFAPGWHDLSWGKVPLVDSSVGALGRRRVASNTGRQPRRLQRLLTDPERRVFDRKVRGRGGIVVIDISGSMSWSRDEIRKIVEKAPGATVVAYSQTRNGDNAWVLAKDGKMFREANVGNAGNGVDYPMLVWAVKNRRGNEPIVWVTDGGVTGKGDQYHSTLARQCREYCRRNGIIVLPNMTMAVDGFKKMATGHRVKSKLPHMLNV